MKGNKITVSIIIISIISIILLFIIISLIINLRIYLVNDKNFKKTLNKKNIIIYTIETRDIKINKIHNYNVNQYSLKHGYTYYFFDKYENKLDLPIYWWKLQSMLDIFKNNNCDYVLWLDSDAFFVDNDVSLESLIELSADSSIFIGIDWSILNILYKTYCAGVFLIKNDKVGKSFLEDCINVYINNHNCKVNNKYTLNSIWAGECYEQGVMNELLKTKYKNNIFIIPYSFVLNNSKLSKNTVISHIYGDKENTYNEIMNFYKSQ
jgi:hypothetical protein